MSKDIEKILYRLNSDCDCGVLNDGTSCIVNVTDVKKIIDLYQKEKNKKYKELENADLTNVYLNGFYDGEKKWKNKIREKIKELDIEIQQCQYEDDDIEEYKNDMKKEKSRLLRNKKILQELLEDNNAK